ncbi:hypothetical protein [Ferrimonas sp. YFM]|uniref:hypothetical protein n=1 Tax=Ferrimonas sp. YFM TaxID=3028878 RepID=UPI0025734712|nr:hypothetical protein [Ferrimonas sp. YFM]BDY04260.1 hypothetical protein F0521_13010 [Ferrimonas sp. YFM]
MTPQLITPTPASYLRERFRQQAYELPMIFLILWLLGDPNLVVVFIVTLLLPTATWTIKLTRHPHKYAVSLTADAIEGPSGDRDSSPANKPRHRFLLRELDLTRCPQPGWRQFLAGEYRLYSNREKMPNNQPRSVVIRKDLIGRRRAQALVEQVVARARALQQERF